MADGAVEKPDNLAEAADGGAEQRGEAWRPPVLLKLKLADAAAPVKGGIGTDGPADYS